MQIVVVMYRRGTPARFLHSNIGPMPTVFPAEAKHLRAYLHSRKISRRQSWYSRLFCVARMSAANPLAA